MIPGWLRRTVETGLDPLVARLIASGVRPNSITTVGTLVSVGSGIAFGAGRMHAGGALLLLSGMFDILDGKVARQGRGSTAFGAFYDSTLDRIADTAIFLGITIYFVRGGLAPALVPWGVALAVLAMSFSLTVSYARARAEGLGLDGKVGVAQRAERILGLGVPSLFFGAGPDGLLLSGIVAVLALLSGVTVVQRIVYVYQQTRSDESKPGLAHTGERKKW